MWQDRLPTEDLRQRWSHLRDHPRRLRKGPQLRNLHRSAELWRRWHAQQVWRRYLRSQVQGAGVFAWDLRPTKRWMYRNRRVRRLHGAQYLWRRWYAERVRRTSVQKANMRRGRGELRTHLRWLQWHHSVLRNLHRTRRLRSRLPQRVRSWDRSKLYGPVQEDRPDLYNGQRDATHRHGAHAEWFLSRVQCPRIRSERPDDTAAAQDRALVRPLRK